MVPAFGAAADQDTVSPVKHLVVIIGENRSFDHLFGLYRPKPGQTVDNVLSKGILNADGSPGPNYALAAQYKAVPQPAYFVGAAAKTRYEHLPPPVLVGTLARGTDDNPIWHLGVKEPAAFATETAAAAAERDLDPADIRLLTTGTTGLATTEGADTRIVNYASLSNGPFPLSGPGLPYDSYTGDTVHRFFQMWQQSDCAARNVGPTNPSGCLNDLYPWVAGTSAEYDRGGGSSLGFYNVNAGDASYLKSLADAYTMSDNYHQAEMGGTMIEHSQIAAADTLYYEGGADFAAAPSKWLADPDPRPGTENRYKADGIYVECADASQPGVAAILNYLAALPRPVRPNCEPGYFYAINNFLPGFDVNGTPQTGPYNIPPSSLRTIGDALAEHGISFKYYGGGFAAAQAGRTNTYCRICNPFQYETRFMADPAMRTAHMGDVGDLFDDVARGTVPAVAYVKPDGWLDGHPQSSKVDLFEAFAKRLIDRILGDPSLAASTAILVTFDEGGGYWDSGYIQPLDFFGDGPRIPIIAVSPWSRGGRIVHVYADHASVVKFIERNWRLGPLTARSRDNLPNPVPSPDFVYAPANGPAIGDLFDMFDFGAARAN